MRTAGKVGAGFERERGGLIEGHGEIVALVEILDGPAIGDNVTFETPIAAKKIVKKMIGASGFAVDGVVRAHDGIGVAFHDRGAEGGRVRVVKIVIRNGNIEAVAERFRSGMDGIVFGSGNDSNNVRVVALNAVTKATPMRAVRKGSSP